MKKILQSGLQIIRGGKMSVLIKIPGKKRPVKALTWKEAKPIVEKTIKENKKFFDELAEL